MSTLKKLIVSSLGALGFFVFNVNANAACGKLVIAEQNWSSAELMANVDKIILEKGYVIPPTKPGLGVELREEIIDKYKYSGKKLHLEMTNI